MEHHLQYMHAVPSFCVEHRNTIEVELIKIFFPATACKQNESSVIILFYVCVYYRYGPTWSQSLPLVQCVCSPYGTILLLKPFTQQEMALGWEAVQTLYFGDQLVLVTIACWWYPMLLHVS